MTLSSTAQLQKQTIPITDKVPSYRNAFTAAEIAKLYSHFERQFGNIL